MADTPQQPVPSEPTPLTLQGVDVAVLIFESLGEVRSTMPSITDQLADALEAHTPESLFMFSQNMTSASVACSWLGIIETAKAYGGDLSSHYPPTVMTYDRTEGRLAIYALNKERRVLTLAVETRSILLIENRLISFPDDVQHAFSRT